MQLFGGDVTVAAARRLEQQLGQRQTLPRRPKPSSLEALYKGAVGAILSHVTPLYGSQLPELKWQKQSRVNYFGTSIKCPGEIRRRRSAPLSPC
jgi:hypothetical protein